MLLSAWPECGEGCSNVWMGASVHLPSLLSSRRTQRRSASLAWPAAVTDRPRELPFISIGHGGGPGGSQPSLGRGLAFCCPHPGDWHAPLTHECQPILTTCAGLGQGSGRSLACAVCPPQRNLWMRGGGGCAMGCWTPPRVQPLPGQLAPGNSDLSYIPSGLLNFIFRIHLLGDPEFSHKSSYSSGPGGQD